MAISTATLEGPETRDSAARALALMKEGIDRAEHLRDDMIERTKVDPVRGLAIAAGVGFGLQAA